MRRVLSLAAVCAMRNNPRIKTFAKRLRSQTGKGDGRPRPGRPAACASMHKLVRIIFGVLKSGTPYNPAMA